MRRLVSLVRGRGAVSRSGTPLPFRVVPLSLLITVGCASAATVPLASYPLIPAAPSAELEVPEAEADAEAFGLAAPLPGQDLASWTATWLDGPVSVIATREEQGTYGRLDTAAQRAQFVELFWVRRDPDLQSANNSYLRRFARGVVAAERLYGGETAPGWQTAFGMTLLVFGAPDRSEVILPRQPVPGEPERGEAETGGAAFQGLAVSWEWDAEPSDDRYRGGSRYGPLASDFIDFTFWDGHWRIGCSPVSAAPAPGELGTIDGPNREPGSRSRGRGWQAVSACPPISNRVQEAMDGVRDSTLRNAVGYETL